MDYQSVTFVVWLAMAVLALVGADLHLWHTRRVLAQVHQDQGVTHARLAPAPAPGAAPNRSSTGS